jgi:hypothetical protein
MSQIFFNFFNRFTPVRWNHEGAATIEGTTIDNHRLNEKVHHSSIFE